MGELQWKARNAVKRGRVIYRGGLSEVTVDCAMEGLPVWKQAGAVLVMGEKEGGMFGGE